MTAEALAFAAVTAIENGEWDRFLAQIALAVRRRLMLLDRTRQPSEPLPRGQVWVWMNGPGTPHWEIRGTGALVEEP